MSYESNVEPIKIGYLNDIKLTANFKIGTIFEVMRLVFDEGH